MDYSSPLREKLKKINALAKSGIAGEKTAAQKLLNDLLKKHNLTLQDIQSDILQQYAFRAKNKYEAAIFHHCAMKFFNAPVHVYQLDNEPLVKVLELTKYEILTFDDFINFHITQFRKEFDKINENLALVYVNKHNLFPEETQTYSMSDESMQEFNSIANMMEDVSYHKSLK